jgi:hypothetical protein
MRALTLSTSPLHGVAVLDSVLGVGVAPESADAQLLACALAHPRQQLDVADWLVLAVAAPDDISHVLLHLCSAEYAWSARARLGLEGGSAAVPPLMPPADGVCSASDCEALSECLEAAAPAVGRVLGEDVLLVLWSEGAHG